jgi:hypothetical protein
VICDDVTQHRAHHALAPVMLAIFNRTANRRGDQCVTPSLFGGAATSRR